MFDHGVEDHQQLSPDRLAALGIAALDQSARNGPARGTKESLKSPHRTATRRLFGAPLQAYRLISPSNELDRSPKHLFDHGSGRSARFCFFIYRLVHYST